jgi:hypothetical protein
VHHPECQNEIDFGWKPDALPFAQMKLDPIPHTGLRCTAPDLREHGRLNIRRNHTTCSRQQRTLPQPPPRVAQR